MLTKLPLNNSLKYNVTAGQSRNLSCVQRNQGFRIKEWPTLSLVTTLMARVNVAVKSWSGATAGKRPSCSPRIPTTFFVFMERPAGSTPDPGGRKPCPKRSQVWSDISGQSCKGGCMAQRRQQLPQSHSRPKFTRALEHSSGYHNIKHPVAFHFLFKFINLIGNKMTTGHCFSNILF